METRIIIAGSRNYENYKKAKKFIDRCIAEFEEKNEIIILSGGAKGADSIGERYAKERGYKIEKFLPEWNKYGRAAGPKRNEKMAQTCDFVICFWDGKSKGTKSMIDGARKLNKRIWIEIIE